jgi:hypothetical protein
LGAVLWVAPRAHAGNILFVSDSGADTGIVGVLTGEGHTVMMVTNDYATGNATLAGSLSSYDAVFWSASGSGSGSTHTNAAVFTNLTSYVMGGGRVFVTGYDSVASPPDPNLITFLGATGSLDLPGAPAAITSAANSLTTGVVDIRGVTPTGGSGDKDALTGLAAGTVPVSGTVSQAQWTLRALGPGEIAYVSNGDGGSSSTTSWTNTAAGGAGAYNAAVRNFANVVLGGAPVIRFTGDNTAPEGMDVMVNVMVEDREGDAFTFSWDLDADGTYGEMAGVTDITIPGATTDGDGTVTVSVEASDGTETRTADFLVNITNVPPTITSTPDDTTAFINAEWSYQLSWDDPAGMLDFPAFSFNESPPGMMVSLGGRISFTPSPTDRDMTFPVEVQIDDGDGGTDTQMFDLLVSNNRPPNEPLVPVSPINRVSITETMPTLIVQNGTDPDMDTLSYFFRIDRVSSFDSAFLIESPEIVEMGGGQTAWTVPSILEPGQYFWQVKASDGIAETDWANALFTLTTGSVEEDAGTPPLTDGGTIAPPPTLGRSDRGGCCGVAGVDGEEGLPAIAVGLFLIAVLGRRRRR